MIARRHPGVPRALFSGAPLLRRKHGGPLVPRHRRRTPAGQRLGTKRHVLQTSAAFPRVVKAAYAAARP